MQKLCSNGCQNSSHFSLVQQAEGAESSVNLIAAKESAVAIWWASSPKEATELAQGKWAAVCSV